MDRMKYDVGTRVMIYEDPITKEKPEGEAILRQLRAVAGLMTRWRVEFLDELGHSYQRTIAVEDGHEIVALETKR